MQAHNLYWLKPVLLLAWFLLGLAVALGHHFLYLRLDGRIVQSEREQTWYLSIGTGFAFLAKTFLAAAAILAYEQLMWQSLRSRPVTISGIDSLFGAPHNAWNLTSLELWQRGPFAAFVAVVAWLLPLSAVFTPSTLVVVQSPLSHVNVSSEPIQLFDSAPEKYASWGTDNDETGSRFLSNYLKPTPSILRLVSNTASTGSILPIQAPYPNSSYALDFYGPSISCASADPDIQEMVQEILDEDPYIRAYVGFVPSRTNVDGGDRIDDSDKYGDIRNGLNLTLQSASTVAKLITYDLDPPEGHSRLFVVTRVPPRAEGGKSTHKVTECGLFNSSYAVEFNFTNNQQSINPTKVTQLNGIDFNTYYSLNSTSGDSPNFFSGIVGCSLMDALSKMLVGYLRVASTGDGWFNDGEIQVIKTVLMDTQELRGLYQPVGGNTEIPMLEPLSIHNMSLAEGTEELSQNMTLSLFSNSYLLQNRSSASTGSITVLTPQNAYSYNPRNLALAYGLGVAFSAIAVIAGLICMFSADGSFSTSFSTILRTTRGPQLESLVQVSETHGKDPAPNGLSKTKIMLKQQSGKADAPTFFVVEETAEVELHETRKPWEARGTKAQGTEYSLLSS